MSNDGRSNLRPIPHPLHRPVSQVLGCPLEGGGVVTVEAESAVAYLAGQSAYTLPTAGKLSTTRVVVVHGQASLGPRSPLADEALPALEFVESLILTRF